MAVEIPTKWQSPKLGAVISFEYGSPLPKRNRIPGDYPVMGSSGIDGYHNTFWRCCKSNA